MSFPFLPRLRPAGCGDPGAEIPFACLFDATGQYLTGTGGPGTLVAWVRRARLGAASNIVTGLAFAAADTLAGSTAVYRDPAAWMVVQANTNGVWVNHALVATGIATIGTVLGSALGGYLADVRYYAGVDLAPGSDSYINRFGVPVPRRYAGPRSAADWRREFADPLNLGADTSGNGNHAVATGLTVANQVTDTPTHGYATFNPLDRPNGGTTAIAGNLVATHPNGDTTAHGIRATPLPDNGVWYWEIATTSFSVTWVYQDAFGLQAADAPIDSTSTYAVYTTEGLLRGPYALAPTTRQALTSGDSVGFVADADAGTLEVFVNGVSQGVCFAGLPKRMCPYDIGYGGTMTYNFGQRPWTFAPPGGARPLCTADMPCPAIKRPERYVTARLRSGGDGVADLPWSPLTIKTLVLSKRRDASDWRVNDTLRPGRAWATNTAGVEIAEADGLTLTPTGYTIGAAAAYQGNRIDRIWRASRAAGFDMLLVDHVSGSPTIVPHAVGGVIDYAWVVPLDGGNRRVYHRAALGSDTYRTLNYYSSTDGIGLLTDAGWFAASAVDMTLGASLPSGRYAVYAWRAVPQFSHFGVYVGNGLVDGPFAAMDFSPALACIFRAAGSASHTMYDTALNPANPAATVLYASTAGGEDTYSAVDILSNGIKVRAPGPSGALNTSAAVYALAAWAETPGKFGRAR